MGGSIWWCMIAGNGWICFGRISSRILLYGSSTLAPSCSIILYLQTLGTKPKITAYGLMMDATILLGSMKNEHFCYHYKKKIRICSQWPSARSIRMLRKDAKQGNLFKCNHFYLHFESLWGNRGYKQGPTNTL